MERMEYSQYLVSQIQFEELCRFIDQGLIK